MKKSKKKAFTLTELLVVVIVIGVLSAVVLPKFSKIIETRKTTEAEELMASVRTEQEKRCALDKPYLTAMSEMTDIVKNNDTKNFTITLAARGIDAASKGKYSYTLKMPSYADGRICCDGGGCPKLNKNYPTCEELKGKPDYQESPADCAGFPPVPECSGDAEEPCGCKNGGKRTRTCDTTTGQWSVWGDCSIADTCECPESTKPKTSQTCNSCGKQTRTVTCNTETGEWTTGSWSTCSKTTAQCSGGGGGGGSSDPCTACSACYSNCENNSLSSDCTCYCASQCVGCPYDCGAHCDYTDCGAEGGAEYEPCGATKSCVICTNIDLANCAIQCDADSAAGFSVNNNCMPTSGGKFRCDSSGRPCIENYNGCLSIIE